MKERLITASMVVSELLVRLSTATGLLGEKEEDRGLVITLTGDLLMYLCL